MREKLSSFATVLSAFLMSGCCLGPLILIPIGLSGFAGTLAIFATKYQPVLMLVTLLFLGFSFYLVYGRKCKKKSTVITLWISTVLVLIMFSYTLLAKGYV
ncbi:mercuric transport protein MerT [Paenibacillus alkaliterrae]|uniref:mercuric transport protein MerT n=1 Tax=Paenibacillus alkaliterrae TaxID=320909 RepID=UPI001F2E42F1|nr:mercuric transport protein MerT [Paenibacillus alkaliterrae]MCF2940601.1 mercuric transport protein MerT [Paenibacillus alkaliterrae]